MCPRSGSALEQRHRKSCVELQRRWLLERGDLAPLRIDAGHHVLDRAVLAGGVESLQDDQQRVGPGRVKQFLGLRKVGPEAVEVPFCELLGRVGSASSSHAALVTEVLLFASAAGSPGRTINSSTTLV